MGIFSIHVIVDAKVHGDRIGVVPKHRSSDRHGMNIGGFQSRENFYVIQLDPPRKQNARDDRDLWVFD